MGRLFREPCKKGSDCTQTSGLWQRDRGVLVDNSWWEVSLQSFNWPLMVVENCLKYTGSLAAEPRNVRDL